MKAQFIYEKFTQDSDPVHDLNIGIYPEKFKIFNLKNRYEAASKTELKHILEFFNTPKEDIYYLGERSRSNNFKHISLIKDLIKDISTQLIITEKFSDLFGDQIFHGYQTSYGKISVTNHDNLIEWFLGDLGIISYLYLKFGNSIFSLT